MLKDVHTDPGARPAQASRFLGSDRLEIPSEAARFASPIGSQASCVTKLVTGPTGLDPQVSRRQAFGWPEVTHGRMVVLHFERIHHVVDRRVARGTGNRLSFIAGASAAACALFVISLLVSIAQPLLTREEAVGGRGASEIRLVLPPLTEQPRRVGESARRAEVVPVTSPVASPGVNPSEVRAQRTDTRPRLPTQDGAVEDRSTSRMAAVERAVASGAVEAWSENGRDGYAFPGAPVVKDGQSCREITVWRRGGDQGEAVTSMSCVADESAASTSEPSGDELPRAE